MKYLKEENKRIATRLAFMLIPVSGLAMDIYVPSFPHMVKDLQVTNDQVRLTLTIFLVSYGLSQLFLGSIVDSWGRYRIGLTALAVFSLSNFLICATNSIDVILFTRALQGIVISLVIVSKRALFIDVYKGPLQKHYTSMLSIVWSSAPILAPFLGGYLQELFGWRANFLFLGIYGTVMFVLELMYSGETLPQFRPFRLPQVLKNYRNFIRRKDFVTGVIILGLSYSMSIIFGMSAPFIIEHTFHLSAVATGYCALVSGLSLLAGGLLSKKLLHQAMLPKLQTASILQLVLIAGMYISGSFYSSLILMIVFVAGLHFLMGFVYNIYFTYCLTQFPQHAGAAGGFTSGGGYITTSALSYMVVHLIPVKDQSSLAVCYAVVLLLIGGALLYVRRALKERQREEKRSLTVSVS
jgi:predicted MFS family arabinose efflux permease